MTFARGAEDTGKISRGRRGIVIFAGSFRGDGTIEHLGIFGKQKRGICVCEGAEFFGEPDKMFFCADIGATLFAELEFVVVCFDGARSVERSEIPLLAEANAFFGCAAVLAVAAVDAGVMSLRDGPCGRVRLEIVLLCESLGGTYVDAGSAADAVVIVEFRFAAISLGGRTGLGGKSCGESRGEYHGDRFFKFS